jgi:hypothetical protein
MIPFTSFYKVFRSMSVKQYKMRSLGVLELGSLKTNELCVLVSFQKLNKTCMSYRNSLSFAESEKMTNMSTSTT